MGNVKHVILLCIISITVVGCRTIRRSRTESFPVAEAVKTLHVQRGMLSYLHPSDFKIRVDSEYCKILQSKDPFCTRMGQLSQTSFSCQFEPNTIHYTHYGSPIYKNDCIKFEIYIFTDKDTIFQVTTLDIIITDTPYDYSLRESQLTLSKPGELIEINAAHVLPRKLVFPSYYHSCTLRLDKSHGWPLHGKLLKNDHNLEQLYTNCSELRLKYQHDGSKLPDVDYVTFSTNVKVNQHSAMKSIKFYLTIKTDNALQNTPPVLLSRSMRLRVTEYSITVLRSLHLQAVDFGSRPNQLLIRIQRVSLSRGTGYIADINHIETPIRGFYQSDVDKGKVVFVAPKGIHRRRILTIFFKAVDSYGLRSNIIHISLLIVPKQKRHLSVLHNPGIYLLEGQSRSLSPVFLKLACSKRRCDRVNINLWNGPQHGTLLKRGSKTSAFNYRDVIERSVVYQHDDSETLRDSIVFVAREPGEQTFFTISIKIEPKDDTPPALSTHRDITLKAGQSVALNNSVLNAIDTDSPVASIYYEVTSPPSKGKLLRLNTADTDPNKEVQDFSQTELLKNEIIYKATQQKVGSDRFYFRVHDQAKPPNYSGTYSLDIWINTVDFGAPFPSSEKQCHILANETSKSLALKGHLAYADRDSTAKDITFKIIDGPKSYPTNLKSKIIYTWPFGFLFQVNEFTQADIDYDKIYVNFPEGELGPRKHIVTFRFIVKDAVGNESPPDECILEILPVNNKPPSVTLLNEVHVLEGGHACINQSHFRIEDPDTYLEDVLVSVKTFPLHGAVTFNKKTVETEDFFPANSLLSGCLLYTHNGEENHKDELQISVTDKVHTVTSYLAINVEPVDDLPPSFDEASSKHLIVMENRTALILPSAVTVSDLDTEDEKIKIYVLERPKFGNITVDGKITDVITQSQITSKKTMYVHRNADVGPLGMNDSFVLGLCPALMWPRNQTETCNANTTANVSVSIYPVHSNLPSVFLGEALVVSEGGQSVISTNELSCSDFVGEGPDLMLRVIKNATYGELQLSAPELGSELIIHKRGINRFPCRAVRDGQLIYIQSLHSGIEPRNDSLSFQIISQEIPAHKFVLSIRIYSVNDEPPKITGRRLITLEQGTSLRILRNDLNMSDMDSRQEDIKLILQTSPKSGSILYMCQAKRMVWRILTTKIKVPFHSCAFIYKHDGSANKVDYFKVVATDGQFYTAAKVKVNVYLKYGVFNLVNQQDVPVFSFVPVKISAKHLLCQVQGLSARLVRYQVLKAPLFGTLSLSQNIIGQQDIMSFSQNDINNGYLFYNLKERPKDLPVFEKISLRVFGRHFKERKIFLRINIDFPKEAHLEVRTNTLDIYQGHESPITSQHLMTKTTNGTADPANIRYRVVKDPVVGVLKLMIGDGSEATTTNFFSQKDINDGRLFFQVPQQHSTENETDGFEFTVAAGNSFELGRLIVNIHHRTRHSLLIRNTLLLAEKGHLTLITPLELRVKEDLNPNKVVYEVFLEPKHGSFLLDGRRIMGAFTQQHINELRVSYVCYSNTSVKDEAVLRVKAENENGHTEQVIFKFSILLRRLESVRLKLVNYKNITTIEELGSLGLGTLINQRHLMGITCNGTANDKIEYVITEMPKLGILLNVTSGKQIKSRVLQEDISGNRVAYVNLENTDQFEDTFKFDVKFGNCTPLHNKQLFIKWSVASIVQDKTTACGGDVQITIIRKGFNNQMATVDVHVFVKKPGSEELTEHEQIRVLFDKGSPYLLASIKIKTSGLTGNEVYFKLQNGFNTAIERQGEQVAVKTDTIFQKCCENCKENTKTKEKKEFKTLFTPDKVHVFKELPLRPHRSPSLSTQRMKFRQPSSPNERRVQSSSQTRRNRNRKKKMRCQRGWEAYRRHCYKIFPHKRRTWRKAAKICLTKLGATLFFPRNPEEERWVSKMTEGSTVWLGIRRNKRGHWLWSDGSAVQFDGKKLTNLNSRADGRARSFCGILHPDGRWNIKDCRAQRYSFVCKKPKI